MKRIGRGGAEFVLVLPAESLDTCSPSPGWGVQCVRADTAALHVAEPLGAGGARCAAEPAADHPDVDWPEPRGLRQCPGRHVSHTRVSRAWLLHTRVPLAWLLHTRVFRARLSHTRVSRACLLIGSVANQAATATWGTRKKCLRISNFATSFKFPSFLPKFYCFHHL